MAANDELQTTRLDGTIHSGPNITVAFQTLEASLRNILGATADSALSAIISMATGPNVTFQGTVTLAGAPTVDLHCATRAYVDSKVADMFSRYYCGRYTQSIPASVFTGVTWGFLGDHRDSNWSAYSAGRLVPPEEGVYLVCVSATFEGDDTGTIVATIDGDDDGIFATGQFHRTVNGQRSVYLTRNVKIASPSSSNCITVQLYHDDDVSDDTNISTVVLRIASTL